MNIKRAIIFLIVPVCVVMILCAIPVAMADGKKGVILSTVDLKADYDTLGIVSYRSSETMPEKINNELKKQAEDMGADYVIGVTYYSGFGYLYGSGTAVKLIKKGN